jgi:hypothetical protein
VAATAKDASAETAGKVKAARVYHLRALAGFNAVHRQLTGFGVGDPGAGAGSTADGASSAFVGTRLEVVRCAQVVSRVVMDFTACMDLVRVVLCEAWLHGKGCVTSRVCVDGLPRKGEMYFTASVQALQPVCVALVHLSRANTCMCCLVDASRITTCLCCALGGNERAPLQLYSVRGDVKLADDTDGWLWRPDTANTDFSGLPVPTSSADGSATDVKRSLPWLTEWESRMLLAGASEAASEPEFGCPVALDQVVVLGLELLRLLSAAMGTLSGAEGGKAPSGDSGCAPTLVHWLKDRSMDVGHGLVRLCQHSRSETILVPSVERELKLLLSRVGVSTSRVQVRSSQVP